ncbi:hypothetical protein HMPREF3293_01952 [Christensenella minuta]|uniref:Uncharacterized protein n=2 Tax=Christensenella minuta TaxID=626937 RepID=A0A136Q3Y4_9FIRM|nr:hypothetical protein HMPREF3293_01952 [Christensenella minuta]
MSSPFFAFLQNFAYADIYFIISTLLFQHSLPAFWAIENLIVGRLA